MTYFTKEKIYLILSSIFTVSLVTGNLIFQKFVDIKFPFINHVFQVSAGLCFFPITFVIADVISEIYGKKKAEYVVLTGLVSGIFVMAITSIARNLDASSWSSVSNNDFDLVFGNYNSAFFASMLAGFIAQILDVRIFISLKLITHKKHLWLRNNVSTIVAQFVDTMLVIFIMHCFGVFPIDDFWYIFLNSFGFKVIFAILDTPFVYLLVHLVKKAK
jgi:hypothetical protein